MHPLALGNVERFLTQSRMIAKKILRTHMPETEEHTMEEIIENMASKLYFHGHPINRKEAKEDLRLKVNMELPPALETAIWELYKDFESEFENLSVFFPAGDLAAQATPPPNAPTQMPLPGNPQMQMQMLIAAAQQAPPVEREYHINHAMVESTRLSSKFTTHRRYRMFTGVPAQPVIQEDILAQGWTHSPAPAAEPQSPQHSTSPGDAPADGGSTQGTEAQQNPSVQGTT